MKKNLNNNLQSKKGGICPFFPFFSALSALSKLISWFSNSYSGHLVSNYVPFMCPDVPCLNNWFKGKGHLSGHLISKKGHFRALKQGTKCPERTFDNQEVKGFRALRALKNPKIGGYPYFLFSKNKWQPVKALSGLPTWGFWFLAPRFSYKPQFNQTTFENGL